jgi:FixJ family two-component response regulator
LLSQARKIAAILVQSAPDWLYPDIMTQNQDKPPTVFIVDDDPAIRFAMQALMDSVNIEHEIFASGDEFLENADDHRAGCLVLDIRMPGLGGLELQDELLKRDSTLPIIFITGHGDVPMAVDAMQKGAVDFIQKPFRDQDLLDRIREALKTDQPNKVIAYELGVSQRTVEIHRARVMEKMQARSLADLVKMHMTA